jgi:hypothetical protein
MNPGKVASMKKILLGVVALVLAAGLAGCEDDTEEKARELSFENRSAYVIQVVSLSTEWQGFTLVPGQKVVLNNIRLIDWYFSSPSSSKVQEASASTERRVIFVNAEPGED